MPVASGHLLMAGGHLLVAGLSIILPLVVIYAGEMQKKITVSPTVRGWDGPWMVEGKFITSPTGVSGSLVS